MSVITRGLGSDLLATRGYGTVFVTVDPAGRVTVLFEDRHFDATLATESYELAVADAQRQVDMMDTLFTVEVDDGRFTVDAVDAPLEVVFDGVTEVQLAALGVTLTYDADGDVVFDEPSSTSTVTDDRRTDVQFGD